MPGPSGTSFSPPGGYGPGNTISIEVMNLPEVLGRFKQYKAGLATQSDRLTERVAQSIRTTARDLVPYDEDNVDEPHVRDNINVEKQAHANYNVVANRGGTRDEVPIYLEIGTYRMAARPFMKPALDLTLSAHGLQKATAEVGGLLPPMHGVGKKGS